MKIQILSLNCTKILSCVWLKPFNCMHRLACMRYSRNLPMTSLQLWPRNLDMCASLRPWDFKPVQAKTKVENRKIIHDHVQMRLRSLVFICFQDCPIFFRADLIKYSHVGFNSKIHFPLSKLSNFNNQNWSSQKEGSHPMVGFFHLVSKLTLPLV